MGVLAKVAGHIGGMSAAELRVACAAKQAELDAVPTGGFFVEDVHAGIDEAVAESVGYVERRLREEVSTRGTVQHRELEPAEVALLAVAAGGVDRLASLWKRICGELLGYERGSQADRFARRRELEAELAELRQAWSDAQPDPYALERERAAELEREQQRLAESRQPGWRPPA